MKRAAFMLGIIGAALALTIATSWIERHGPEQVVYGNLCGPTGDDLCYRPALKGGFPLAFLYDAPGVSREGQLAFVEDHFHPLPFFGDMAIFALLLVSTWAVMRRPTQAEAAAGSSHPPARP